MNKKMMRLIAGFIFAQVLAVPALSQTRYKLVQEEGVWWFQAPDGTKMLSKGVDCVNPGPEPKDYNPANPEYFPLGNPGATYPAWEKSMTSRLKSWGFNTLGGWSATSLTSTGMPFTVVLHIQASIKGGIWGDLWQPEYPAMVADLADKYTVAYRGNPNLVGYFLDNEFGWGDEWFINIALGWEPKAGGKAKAVETMRTFYHEDFAAFSADFKTSARDWEGLMKSKDTTRKPGRGHAAMDAWTYQVARRYYEICSAAVRKADPGALILGDRFRQYYPQAVARAGAGILDAVSTNFEAGTTDGWVSPAYFEGMHRLSGGLPVIIGEFYTAARQNRSGHRNHEGAFTLVDTQEQRAAAAEAQVKQFAAFPFVVGWHWFQFMDEPTFGRGDGEDYNMGLVDLQDKPYAEITAAFAGAHADAEWLHKGGKGPRTDLPWQVPAQAGLVCDGKLGDWDKSKPLPLAWMEVAAPLAPFGDVFLAWDKGNLRIAAGVYDFSNPRKDAPQAGKEETWGEAHRLTLTVGTFTLAACASLVEDESLKAGREVTYSRPPAPGHLQAAVTAKVDAWHYVWEIAIPASELGRKSLKKGDHFRLSMDIQNRGDFERMKLGGDKGLEIVLR